MFYAAVVLKSLSSGTVAARAASVLCAGGGIEIGEHIIERIIESTCWKFVVLRAGKNQPEMLPAVMRSKIFLEMAHL